MKENFHPNTIDEFCRLLLIDIGNASSQKIIVTSRYGYVNVERLKSEYVILIQLK